MKPRIAIPVPHSGKPEYVQRVLPQYAAAVEQAGGEAVMIPLDQSPDEVAALLNTCDAALLPGSSADVDPAKYDTPRDPHTAPPDVPRDTVDELLLQDAYNMRKPILGICYGLQSLNVWRTGTLRQHIDSGINHAQRNWNRVHKVDIAPGSRLAQIIAEYAESSGGDPGEQSPPVRLQFEVNSSHHQSAEVVGDGLRAVARCPDDGVIEALEGTAPGHFVLAVQWHPERSVGDDEASRAIFRAFVEAARQRAEAAAETLRIAE
jgi:putative glutamine amidotransferase